MGVVPVAQNVAGMPPVAMTVTLDHLQPNGPSFAQVLCVCVCVCVCVVCVREKESGVRACLPACLPACLRVAACIRSRLFLEARTRTSLSLAS